MLAYDHSRVIVHHDDKEIYINANIVKVPQANREYILTQGEAFVILAAHNKFDLQDLLRRQLMTSG